jgi:hypothetical protein
MIEPTVAFAEHVAPAVAVQQARGLAEWLRTCVGLVVPASSPASSADRSRPHPHDEQRPAPGPYEGLGPEDDVRQHFRSAVKDIMRQGPLGTDFILCAVGRMAEDILRIAENREQDPQFESE